MSTNTIIGIVIAAVIVIGGGYLVLSGGYSMSPTEQARVGDQNGDGKPDTDVSDTGTQPKMATGAFTGSWAALASRGGNYKCDINHGGTKDATTGTVYISGTSMRGDFNSSTSAGTVASHMLKLGDTIYVWSSAYSQGFMMKATAMTGNGATATKGQGVSADQSYDWNCAATGTEASMFAKPTGIDFIDTAAMMQGGMMPKIPAQ